MRKTLGQVCYPRREQVFEDPEKEASRRLAVMQFRRKQVAGKARAHVDRILREDGLARSIEELHDRQGRPPPNVNLESLVSQYRRLNYQQVWLSTIARSLEEILRELDLVRFLQDRAASEEAFLTRKAEREALFVASAVDRRGDAELPPKLVALLRQEVKRDIRRKEVRNANPVQDRTGDYYLSMTSAYAEHYEVSVFGTFTRRACPGRSQRSRHALPLSVRCLN